MQSNVILLVTNNNNNNNFNNSNNSIIYLVQVLELHSHTFNGSQLRKDRWAFNHQSKRGLAEFGEFIFGIKKADIFPGQLGAVEKRLPDYGVDLRNVLGWKKMD